MLNFQISTQQIQLLFIFHFIFHVILRSGEFLQENVALVHENFTAFLEDNTRTQGANSFNRKQGNFAVSSQFHNVLNTSVDEYEEHFLEIYNPVAFIYLLTLYFL